MKFVCDQCGKKYATAENPAPGKVYKLKCKACGHLIVVKGQAGTTTGLPAITAAEQETAGRPAPAAPVAPVAPAAPAVKLPSPTLTPLPALTPPPVPAAPVAATPAPEIELQVETPPAPLQAPSADPWAAAAPPPEPHGAVASAPPPQPLPPEVADAVDFAAGSAATAPAPIAAPPLDPALMPPAADKDELADFAAAAAAVIAAPEVPDPVARLAAGLGDDPFADALVRGDTQRSEDPFEVASRASLPDGYSGPGSAVANRVLAEPAPPKTETTLGRMPVEQASSGRAPIAIIGLGLAVLLGITAWVLFGSSRKESSPQAPPAVAAMPSPAPTPPPPAPRAEPPAAPSAVAEKAPEPKQEAQPRAAERKPERRPEPRPVAKAEPPRPPPPAPAPQAQAQPQKPAPAPAPAPAVELQPDAREDLLDASEALTPDVVNKVVSANRKAFSSCIASAASSEVTLDGRRVALRITVNTNGTVTYPTLDDQSLNGTEMGQCLKSAARLMIFPKFKGDPFHYEVPLVLSSN